MRFWDYKSYWSILDTSSQWTRGKAQNHFFHKLYQKYDSQDQKSIQSTEPVTS
jgi:hypothetical protein